MPCQINNSSNVDLSPIEPHVQGMYDFFDQKLGFQKPPTMHFDSDPGNQANVLGKTAYYDPSSLEIHVFTDGRHPKDMLRSIAHELIHHQQNLEGRLNVGGYMGEGYYLENEEMRKLEHEAMLEGNATMREWEDTVKLKEKKQMSLKEWKNNELNKLMLKKFGLLKEYKNPDDQQGRLPNETEEEFYKRIYGLEEKIAEATECPKCGAEECKCEEMNEEVVEEETELQEMDRSAEDGEWERNQNKGGGKKGADPMAGERNPGGYPGPKGPSRNSGAKFGRKLQETLKKIANAKNVTLKSSGKKIK